MRRLLCLIVLLALPGLAAMRRLALLFVALLSVATVHSQDQIRYYPPAGLATMTGTATATTSTVPLLLPDGTAVAPGLSWANSPHTGFFQSGSTMYFSHNNTGYIRFGTGLYISGSGGQLAWTAVTPGGAAEVVLERAAANTLALKNSTNNQTFRIYGSSGTTYLALAEAGLQGSKSKTLTDAAAAASVVSIAVATNSYIGGKIIWTATSTDATDQLATSGEQFFSGVDKAGTVTCGTGAALGTATAYTTAKTLVCTVTVATSTTNCDIQASCTNDTAGSQNVIFNYRLDMPLTATVTPQ